MLKQIIDEAVKAAVDGSEAVTERPDQLVDRDTVARVNLFLYQATPNASFRNADLPTRRGDGSLERRPRTALDLHYLLTFLGSERQQVPQRLLGATAGALHAEPLLTRKRIDQVIQSLVSGDPQHYLGSSDLSREVELLKLSPVPLNLEELSKLWSVFFQIPYCLSIAYQGSVVLIDVEATAQPGLPVRARNLYMDILDRPVIDEVKAAGDSDGAIRVEDVLVLRGRGLRGEITRVLVGANEVEPASADVQPREIRVSLDEPPFAAGSLRAGVQGVQVVHLRSMGTPPEPHRGVESAVVPIVLRPAIALQNGDPDVTVSAEQGSNDETFREVTARVKPMVGIDQRVTLLLNRLGGGARKSFAVAAEARTTVTDSMVFRVRHLAAAEQYLVRVQVDGAESTLEADADGAFSSPRITIP